MVTKCTGILHVQSLAWQTNNVSFRHRKDKSQICSKFHEILVNCGYQSSGCQNVITSSLSAFCIEGIGINVVVKSQLQSSQVF